MSVEGLDLRVVVIFWSNPHSLHPYRVETVGSCPELLVSPFCPCESEPYKHMKPPRASAQCLCRLVELACILVACLPWQPRPWAFASPGQSSSDRQPLHEHLVTLSAALQQHKLPERASALIARLQPIIQEALVRWAAEEGPEPNSLDKRERTLNFTKLRMESGVSPQTELAGAARLLGRV